MIKACSMHGMRNAYKIMIRNPEGKRSLGRHGHRWKDNTGMDLRGQDWIHMAQERDQWLTSVNAVRKLWVPYKVGNFLTRCTTISFSRTLLQVVSSYTVLLRYTYITVHHPETVYPQKKSLKYE